MADVLRLVGSPGAFGDFVPAGSSAQPRLVGADGGDRYVVEVELAPAAGRLIAVEGRDGPAGPTGPPGPAFDGTAWHYGSGPPGLVVGSKPGDFYVDVDDDWKTYRL